MFPPQVVSDHKRQRLDGWMFGHLYKHLFDPKVVVKPNWSKQQCHFGQAARWYCNA